MKNFFCYDLLTLIIPYNTPRMKLVNKEWLTVYTYRNLENIEYIIHQIIKGNAKDLRFEYCYRHIYNQSIQKRSPDIIHIINNVCRQFRNEVQWYERKKYARLLNDICMYINSTYIKQNNMKPVYLIALNAIASKKHTLKRKRSVLNSMYGL